MMAIINGIIGWVGCMFMLGIVFKLNYYIFITGWNLI